MRILILPSLLLVFLIFNSCSDDEPKLPKLSFTQETADITEGEAPVTFEIQLDKPTKVAEIFDVIINTDLTYGADFETDPEGFTGTFTLEILADQSSATFTTTIKENQTVDGDRTIFFSLINPGPNFKLGSPSTLSVNVLDND